MDFLDYNEWPIGSERIALLCGVSNRTAQRWLSGQTKPPVSAARLIQLTQRGRILPESWPNHWRIASECLDIGHTKIALNAAMIEHYFHSVHCWNTLLRLLPAIEGKISELERRTPSADIIDLAEYRARLNELKRRPFLLASGYEAPRELMPIPFE